MTQAPPPSRFHKGAPPLTPEQFIALLDSMVGVGIGNCRVMNKKRVYFLSTDDVFEAEEILAGEVGTVYPVK